MQNPIIQQVVETLRGANNVLITVKNSPSVDELTASIALTLILNHMNKHATTVFSGHVPSTIEFLQPEMAIETTTDSLRDFIIALDKAKADKLRYKVENDVVRIFITPYRSSISEEDLEFSQGDFNVDVVVALGVLNKDDFDQAVLEHGRILHDATVIAINNQTVPNEVGTISWQDQQASSVSEMVASIAELFGENVLDGQIATALMTGIVAETDRFKNQKTTPHVLSISSTLMSAGANQQLIAEELEKPPTVVHASEAIASNELAPLNDQASDGTLSVPHDDPEPAQEIHIDEHGNINGLNQPKDEVTALTKVQHDIGLEATKHTENDDIKDVTDADRGDQPELQLVENGDEAHSLVGNRPFLTPEESDKSSDDEPTRDEPSGLFGNFMNRMKSSTRRVEEPVNDQSNREIRSKKPKRIEPIDSYAPQLEFQDNIPLFKASDVPDAAEGDMLAQKSEQPPMLPANDGKVEAEVAEEEHAAAEPTVSTEPVLPALASFQVPVDEPAVGEPSTEGDVAMSPLDNELDDDEQTLAEIEQAVHSPHVDFAMPVVGKESSFVSADSTTEQANASAELPPVVNLEPAQPEQNTQESSPPTPPYTPPDYTEGKPLDGVAAPIVPPPIMPQAGDSRMPQFFEADGTPSKPLTTQS